MGTRTFTYAALAVWWSLSAGPSNVFRYSGVQEQIRASPRGFRIERAGKTAAAVSFENARARAARQTRTGVEYPAIWPGVALRYHPRNGRLEYDFVLDPGADPARIRMRIDTGTARLMGSGELLMGDGVALSRPYAWQDENGRRRNVAVFYRARGRQVTFRLGRYDRSRPLVIDPQILVWSFPRIGSDLALNSSSIAGVTAITTDNSGTVYAAATLVDAKSGAVNGSFIVIRIPAGGSSDTQYFTYGAAPGHLASVTLVSAIAVDSAGNIYLAGYTQDQSLGMLNGYQATYSSELNEAFLLKFAPSAISSSGAVAIPLYGTYLNGSSPSFGSNSSANAIAVANNGIVWMTGQTDTSDFPHPNSTLACERNGVDGGAYIAEIDTTKTGAASLPYARCVVGSSAVQGRAIAVDANYVYLAGFTSSTDFPVTASAWQPTYTTPNDAWGDGFFAQFSLAALDGDPVYSTFINNGQAIAMAVVDSRHVYIAGYADGTFAQYPVGTFVTTANAFSRTPQGNGDVYVLWIDPTQAGADSVPYASLYGGGMQDYPSGMAADADGNVYIVGTTASSSLPTGIVAPLQAAPGGGTDVFFAQFNTLASGAASLVQSTPVGGGGSDNTQGIGLGNLLALAPSGVVYLGGVTNSADFPGGNNESGSGGFLMALSSAPVQFTGLQPTITHITTAAGEAPEVAPNTWIEIKGTNLAPGTRIWQASDFAGNRMPTRLDGVSVTVNGKSAYVYYISQTQVNVLTSLDAAAGPVQVEITNGAAGTASGWVDMGSVSPGFFVINGGKYIAATHADGSLLGPASLYPGVSTPAKPGETVVLYANGFGETSPALVEGSAVQSGTLPQLPLVDIGGVAATVRFAGVVSPGLFQFNVVVPATAQDGDNTLSAQYDGFATQDGVFITVQQ
jgi:uncharacterized protein (TIGR03437 family)